MKIACTLVKRVSNNVGYVQWQSVKTIYRITFCEPEKKEKKNMKRNTQILDNSSPVINFTSCKL